jgi:nicotinate phosphoribosyltransferase
MVSRNEPLALLTDLYQLAMAQSYFRSGKFDPATFSLFIRSYPPNRGYFVCAGLQDVLEYLSDFSFDSAAIDYLQSQELFTDDFLHFLRDLRFTGDLWAVPEGRVFFTDEPILEITAPVIQAQLGETFIINQVNLQSLMATKAARCVHAAGTGSVIDFSLRRTHGIDAGMKVARCSYLAGAAGTSNVLAGLRYGIPVAGTMAHSFVTSFDREMDAFRSYVASFPEKSVLLIDTYDTIAGARIAAQIGREMAAQGDRLLGVRIDSGDLAGLAVEVRAILDGAGLNDVKIIASGGLDEYDLAEFTMKKIPYDGYGVGTKMGTSSDAPWSDMAYKLVEYNNRPILKRSPGKATWPGKKQVFRQHDGGGRLDRDFIGLRGQTIAGAEPLLEKIIDGGKIIATQKLLTESREVFRDEFGRLPESIKQIRDPAHYPVEFTLELRNLREKTEREISFGGV